MKHILEFEEPILELHRKLEELTAQISDVGPSPALKNRIHKAESIFAETKKKVFASLTPWQRVQIARHPERPSTLEYVRLIFSNFIELHGDRRFSDDHAIVGGFAELDGIRIMVIGTQKGNDLRQNIYRNFGCAHPEGYRKVARLIELADKFHLPIITFINTAGAYPGIGAEERHIAESIATCLSKMSQVGVPVVSSIVGEGGSGGALALGVANHIIMQEHAYYSVISPEGCAAILWKDRTAVSKAAEALRITAHDLLQYGLIDEIATEPLTGAHTDPARAALTLKQAIITALSSLQKMSSEELVEQRYLKFRKFGVFTEIPDEAPWKSFAKAPETNKTGI